MKKMTEAREQFRRSRCLNEYQISGGRKNENKKQFKIYLAGSRNYFVCFIGFSLVRFCRAKFTVRDHRFERLRADSVRSVQSFCRSGFYRVESFS